MRYRSGVLLMNTHGRSTIGPGMVALSFALAGCATQNRFADSVTQYNLQTEQAQNRALLLNVLRASRRRPLLFFDISAVNGSSPASGALGLSGGLSPKGETVLQGLSATPSLSLSGGPSVSAGPIITQEFYQGMLKPISMENIDLFVQRGISRDLLFNLFFQKIEISSDDDVAAPAKWRATLTNSPTRDAQVDAFQRVVEWFVDEGLTTQKADDESPPPGPYLLPQEITSGEVAAKSAGGPAPVFGLGWCELNHDQRFELVARLKRPVGRIVSADASETACTHFADTKSALGQSASDGNAAMKDHAKGARDELSKQLETLGLPARIYSFQAPKSTSQIVLALDDTRLGAPPAAKIRGAKKTLLMALSPEKRKDFCDILKNIGKLDDASFVRCEATHSDRIAVTFVPRSPYTIIYYLGELARRSLYPEGDPGEVVFRPYAEPARGLPTSCVHDAYRAGAVQASVCPPIFRIARTSQPQFLDTPYDGQRFGVPDVNPLSPQSSSDPKSRMTYEVLDIVSELVNLNRSAKDVPTSGVLTLRGVP